MQMILLFFLLVWPVFIMPRSTIMLDPAGDAKHPGRLIEDSFERGITIQFAQELKKKLEQCGYSVIISRMPGETRQPLQTVQFANRLPIDLYIHLDCCPTHEGSISIYCYQFSYGEPFKQKFDPLSFVPLKYAHHQSFDRSSHYAQQFVTKLQKKHVHQFHIYGPYQLPLAALSGIHAPAFSLECTLPLKDDWVPLVAPIAQVIKEIVV